MGKVKVFVCLFCVILISGCSLGSSKSGKDTEEVPKSEKNAKVNSKSSSVSFYIGQTDS